MSFYVIVSGADVHYPNIEPAVEVGLRDSEFFRSEQPLKILAETIAIIVISFFRLYEQSPNVFFRIKLVGQHFLQMLHCCGVINFDHIFSRQFRKASAENFFPDFFGAAGRRPPRPGHLVPKFGWRWDKQLFERRRSGAIGSSWVRQSCHHIPLRAYL